jgi:hypothetical protein
MAHNMNLSHMKNKDLKAMMKTDAIYKKAIPEI